MPLLLPPLPPPPLPLATQPPPPPLPAPPLPPPAATAGDGYGRRQPPVNQPRLVPKQGCHGRRWRQASKLSLEKKLADGIAVAGESTPKS